MHHSKSCRRPRLARHAAALAAACAAACGLVAAPAALAGGVRFDLQALPVSPGLQQSVTGLNASGVVVGVAFGLRSPSTAFRFENGVISLLPRPVLDSVLVGGISDNGLMVGTSGAPGRWQAGLLGATFTPIAALAIGAGDATFANAVDPGGRSVAGRTILASTVRSWIHTEGALVEIPLMSDPVAINSAGQVAGNLTVANRPRAALYSGGITRELGTLGGAGSWVTGLNASGTVIGESELAGAGKAGFVYDNGSLRATTAAAGSDTFLPAGINDLAQIVGQGFNRNSGLQVAQLAAGTAAAPVALNAYLSAAATDTLVLAKAINPSGQIAGTCASGQSCLLTPTGTLAWAVTTGGSFDDARHWDSGLGFAPNRHLDVVIAPAASVTVLANRGAEMKSLVVGTTEQGASQATLQLAQGARLVSSGATARIERSGILQGDGVLAGGLINRGTLQGTAATPLHLTVEGFLDNQGLVTGSGRINTNLINRGSSPGVRVGAGELLTIAGTAHSGADGSVLEVRNGGELRIEGRYTAQAGSFIRLDNATLRVSGLLNAGTVQIGFGGASVFGDVVNSLGSSNGRIIASGGSEVTFWGRVVNHNEVRAAAGSHIVYFGDVSGPGSFTTQGEGAYHRFEAAYNPAGSTTAVAAVDVGDAEFNDALGLDIAGTQAGSGFDQIHFVGSVLFDANAQLALTLQDGFAPAAGDRFQLFDYSQAPEGRFAALSLPTLADGLAWDTRDLYAGGTLAVSNVPEPASAALLLLGVAVLLQRGRRARCRIQR
ncbi:MAG: hypothetical protein A3E25_12910 [Burkholderiales bacterium RIFCSPHIGHO2_12_FULL_69_20]|nr:MAG: hypothetical protein A3E25_12910 [Burkholderiales bacterium RIFCSPHIGHO2_12_FULL_69_20]